MSKVIYLDIEGVIVSRKSIIAAKPKRYRPITEQGFLLGVDRVCFSLILYMAKKHGATICVTSTLRTFPFVESCLRKLASDLGYPNAFHEKWRTANTDSKRALQIEQHMLDNRVSKFVVLDDNEVRIRNFVYVPPEDGFGMEHYEQAQKHIADDPENIEPELIFL